MGEAKGEAPGFSFFLSGYSYTVYEYTRVCTYRKRKEGQATKEQYRQVEKNYSFRKANAENEMRLARGAKSN